MDKLNSWMQRPHATIQYKTEPKKENHLEDVNGYVIIIQVNSTYYDIKAATCICREPFHIKSHRDLTHAYQNRTLPFEDKVPLDVTKCDRDHVQTHLCRGGCS
jgi:hypothetical protein